MKNNRQTMILEIIAKETSRPRSSCWSSCRSGASASTQATISRDIKQLHLVKEPTGHGTLQIRRVQQPCAV